MPTPLPANPWLPEQPFPFDEDAFMAAIEPAPVFLDNPSSEYLDTLWSMPIVEVLTKY